MLKKLALLITGIVSLRPRGAAYSRVIAIRRRRRSNLDCFVASLLAMTPFRVLAALLIAMALVTQAYAATEFVSTIKQSGGEGIKLDFGLEVDPPEIVLKDCPLGKEAAVSDLGGKKLIIQNKGTTAYTYAINVLFASEAGDSLKEGYRDIPDKSWIIPENKEVYIPANSAKEVELYLKIPKRKEYYDKKYQAVIEVKSKKNRPEDIFVLSAQLRICLATIKLQKMEVAK